MRIAWGRRYCAVPPQLLHPTGYNPSLYRVAVGSAVPFTSGHGRAHTLPDSLDTPLMLLSASSPAPQYSTLRRCWATRYHIHSPILTHTPPIIPCHGHGAGAGGAGITGRGRTGVCGGVVRTTLGGAMRQAVAYWQGLDSVSVCRHLSRVGTRQRVCRVWPCARHWDCRGAREVDGHPRGFADSVVCPEQRVAPR